MSDYLTDRQWADRLLPQIKRIIGPYLLLVANDERDQKEATDLLILHARDMRIAVRVRRPGYADDYPFDFTIRTKRSNGTKTELAKIVDGWGDWFFYGHSDEAGNIIRWFLIDLDALRAALIREKQQARRLNGALKDNIDGSTSFVAFDVRSFVNEPPILVASSHPLDGPVNASDAILTDQVADYVMGRCKNS